MDPSYYSPQTRAAKSHHSREHLHGHQGSPAAGSAVCYCRVHGTLSPGHYLADPYQSPPSPVTRQLMQQHPEAVLVQTGQTTKIVPCQVVYHQHQPVFGFMAHNTLDGATAIARQRRQYKQQQQQQGAVATAGSSAIPCQNPRCCQNKKSRNKSRKSKNGQNSSKCATSYKSAPSSPVGTPRKLVTNMTQHSQQQQAYSAGRKKELTLNPPWITAFPTIETPSESGFPLTGSGKLTGCCGRSRSTANNPRRPRSNSYSALDSTSDDGINIDDPKGLGVHKPKPVRNSLFFALSIRLRLL